MLTKYMNGSLGLFSKWSIFIVHNCRWAEVEDERTKVNTEDETAVFASAKKLYEASLQYLDRMREIEAQQLKILR